MAVRMEWGGHSCLKKNFCVCSTWINNQMIYPQEKAQHHTHESVLPQGSEILVWMKALILLESFFVLSRYGVYIYLLVS